MEKRTAHTSWAVVLLIVLVCVGIAALGSYLITHAGRTSAGTCTPTNVRAGSDVRILGEGIVYYDGAMIGALDKNGEVKWNYSAGINAEYNVGPGGIATWTHSALSFINKDTGSTLYSSVTTTPVISAVVGPQYAAVMFGSEAAAQMRIYELTGREIDQIDLSGKTVLDYGFFSNGALLWVMALDTSGSVPMSTITTYQPGKSTLGSVTEIEEVLYKTQFQASRLKAIGTTHIKTYDYTGTEVQNERKLIYGWYVQAVDENVSDPLMALVPVAQSEALAEIRDVKLLQGTSERVVRMPFPCDAVFCQGGTLYGFADSAVMICPPGSTVVSAYQLPIHIDRVIGVTEAKIAVIESGSIVYYITLP